MDYRRVIPCLDMKDGRVVKGVHFVNLKELGDPAEAGAARPPRFVPRCEWQSVP